MSHFAAFLLAFLFVAALSIAALVIYAPQTVAALVAAF